MIYDCLEPSPALIISPKRIMEDTWPKEVQRWEHLKHLKVVKINGTAKQRRDALTADADIMAISRDNVAWLVKECGRNWPFKIVVIDESSSFKNHASKRFKALRSVLGRIDRVYALSGTPSPQGIQDLWSQVYLLDRGERLGRTLGAFRAKYLEPEKMNGHIVYSYRPRKGAQEEIQEKLKDIAASLKKEDYLDLPEQQYINVELTLPSATMKAYKRFEREQVMQVMDGSGEEIVAFNAASLTGKLLQFSNGAIYDEQKGVHELHDVKLEALEELIEAANGNQVLIYYAFKHDADRIQKRIECRRLDKPKDIDDWNAGKIRTAIAHPASVGHGLNLHLSQAHITVWFGLTYSLELYAQANSRLHRPGQTHTCFVYHLIASGTHDERVLKALKSKDTSQRALIDALKQVIETEDKP